MARSYSSDNGIRLLNFRPLANVFRVVFPPEHVLVERSDRHLADDGIHIVLVAAIDDFPFSLVRQDRADSRILVGLSIPLASGHVKVVQAEQRRVDLGYVLAYRTVFDVRIIPDEARLEHGVALENARFQAHDSGGFGGERRRWRAPPGWGSGAPSARQPPPESRATALAYVRTGGGSQPPIKRTFRSGTTVVRNRAHC